MRTILPEKQGVPEIYSIPGRSKLVTNRVYNEKIALSYSEPFALEIVEYGKGSWPGRES